MTVKEFIDFNWQKDKNGHRLCNIGDVYVIIMNKISFKNEDKILEALISIDNLYYFSDYTIINIGKHTENSGETTYTTLKIIIYKEEQNENN